MTIAFNDAVNGLFELISGFLLWMNTYRMYCDKCIRGVSLVPSVFFALWGYWNLYYYPSLNQMLSFWGGANLALANTSWVGLMIYYTVREQRGSK